MKTYWKSNHLINPLPNPENLSIGVLSSMKTNYFYTPYRIYLIAIIQYRKAFLEYTIPIFLPVKFFPFWNENPFIPNIAAMTLPSKASTENDVYKRQVSGKQSRKGTGRLEKTFFYYRAGQARRRASYVGCGRAGARRPYFLEGW